MFGYYGSKTKIAHLYHPPTNDLIIEPFAGSAKYALRYFDRDVTLVDKYDVITNIWKWLQTCSEKDILGIRQLKYGESSHDFEWSCQEEKDLIGFIVAAGVSAPRRTAGRWKTVLRPNTQQYKLQEIASNLYKIRHWKIVCGDYQEIENQQATWFIDPPYMKQGKHYKYNKIDYSHLSKWCQERNGQVIVCEGEGADWLPFRPLVQHHGSTRFATEYVWYNEERSLFNDFVLGN